MASLRREADREEMRMLTPSAEGSEEDDDASRDGEESCEEGDGGRCSWHAFRDKLVSDPYALAGVVLFVWVAWGLFLYCLRPWGEDRQPYTVIEALYIMAQIITTVGYGDQTPFCAGGMVFTCMYVIIAIVVLSSLLTAFTDYLLKRKQEVMGKAIKLSFGIPSKGRARSDSSIKGNVDLPAGWKDLFSNFGIWSLCVLSGTLFMYMHPGELPDDEGLGKLIKAFYFSIITLTTVGFGDITPRTQDGKLFCAFWMLFGWLAFAYFVSSFSAVMAQQKSKHVKSQDPIQIMMEMDRDIDRTVGQSEFLAYVLHKHGIAGAVSMDALSDIINIITKEFKELDNDGSGTLEIAELKGFKADFLVKHKSGIGEQLGLKSVH